MKERINADGESHESAAPRETLTPEYFEQVYAANRDPWSFETSAYEAAKYDATLAALPRKVYGSAFEIGCSIGVLTYRLAARCDRLLSVDVSERALKIARDRCRDLPHVELREMSVPGEFPNATFDLILLSEVGYYLSPDDLRRARRLIVDHLAPGAHLLLVHWTPRVHDYPLTGDEVHAEFLQLTAEPQSSLRHLHGSREERYRLDLFERV